MALVGLGRSDWCCRVKELWLWLVEEGVTGAELEHVAGQFPKINSLNEFKEMKITISVKIFI